MTYYQIDNKIYYFNLDAIFDLTSETPNTEKVVNTTITQYYGGDSEKNANNGKEIVESKSSINEVMNNIRYDFIKNIVSCLLANKYDTDGSVSSIMHLNELSFAQGLCLNTLIEYKILLELEVETNE